ncbi:hypothetical protein V2O64_12280 [Verrucomicrobiaceae bacterium 227]
MQIYHFIAPALALIAIIFVIGRQETALAEYREKTQVVRERLKEVTAARALAKSTPSEVGGTAPKTDDLTLPDGSPDWNAIFKLTTEAMKEGGARANLTKLPEFQKRITAMSEDEIAEGMAKIRDLDLDEKSRRKLESGLLIQLAGKAPLKTLELIGDPINERQNPLGWPQQIAFSKLVREDTVAAMAWLDRQIKEGKLIFTALSPDDNPRFHLERTLIGQLIGTDLTTAMARTTSLSKEERDQLFDNTREWRRDDKMPLGFLTLARTNLSENRATSVIAEAWACQQNGTLTAVDQAFEEISFSNKEREAIIDLSVKNFTQVGEGRNDYETAYEWAAERAPTQAASTIAKTLLDGSDSGNSFDEQFKKSMELAEKFDAPTIVTEFARRYDPHYVYQKITDPALLDKMNELRTALPKENE